MQGYYGLWVFEASEFRIGGYVGFTGFPISGIFVEAEGVQKEVPRCGDWGGLKAQECLSNVRV